MIEGGGLADAIPWVLAAVLVGETVGAAASLPARLRLPGALLAAAAGLVLAALVSGLEPRLARAEALGRARRRRRPRARGAERRDAPVRRRRPVARRRAAARRRAVRDARGDPRRVAAGGGARLPVLRARRPADARGVADHRHRQHALAPARVRDRRADRLLPVARAAAAAPRDRRCRAGRDRARRRAAAEPRHRPRRPLVRLPHVGRGARHALVGALRLGAQLRPHPLAARRPRDAPDPDAARAVLEAREPRGLRRPALGDARGARRVRP